MDLSRFQNLAQNFLNQVDRELQGLGFIIPPHWNIDHLCYRTETLEQYRALREVFSQFASELIETPVNGRPITTYKLSNPVWWRDWCIDLVELPAPKAHKKVKEGLEHIEIVCDLSFDELAASFAKSNLEPSGLIKPFNQELELVLTDCAVKFHHMSLESVVTLEGHKQAFTALKKSDVLNILKDFEPLIAGTIPLNIDNFQSEVDILLFSTDLDLLLSTFDLFAHLKNFEKSKTTKNNSESVVCRFECDGLLFELFGQTTRSVKQRAFQHFQIEERLLKLGGPSFRQKIKALKAKGLKTEPAIAQLLNLKDDPYSALLELRTLSDKQLRQIF